MPDPSVQGLTWNAKIEGCLVDAHVWLCGKFYSLGFEFFAVLTDLSLGMVKLFG